TRGARRRPRFQVEHVAGVMRELPDVGVVSALLLRNLLGRQRRLIDYAGDNLRYDAERGVLGENQQHAQRWRHRGEWNCRELLHVHERRQVLALDDELADASVTGLCLDVS